MAAWTPDALVARDGRLLLPWVQFDLLSYGGGAGTTTFRWSDVPIALADAFVEPRVLAWTRFARALSGDDGGFEVANFGWTIADVDRALLDLADDTTWKYWVSRYATWWLIDGPGRTAGDTPYAVARGVVRAVEPQPERALHFTAEDYLASEFSASYLDQMLPRRRIEKSRFAPTAPEEAGWHAGVAGLPEPIIYGRVSDGDLAAPDRHGAVPCYPVGAESISSTYWVRCLIAGHACKEVEALYVNGVVVGAGRYGVDVLCPGQAGWPFGTASRDIGGRRYTVVYLLGPDGSNVAAGTSTLSADVKGCESAADGTGTLYTSIWDQYEHWYRNFVIQDYLTGAWLSVPTWPDSTPHIDTASFSTAKTTTAYRVSGLGYLGQGVVGNNGDLRTARQWLAAWNGCADARCGFNRLGQFMVACGDPSTVVLALTDQDDVIADSFVLQSGIDELRNVIPYSFARQYLTNVWAVEGRRVVASDSVTGYRRRLEDQERPLWFVRDQATADDLATHYVHRKMHPPRHVRLDTGLHGLTAELGSTISLTHADGPGDSAAGWVTRQLMVEAVEVDLGEGRVSLLCWDYEVMPGYPPSVTYEAGEVPAGVAFSLGAGQGVSSGTQTVTIIQGMTRIYLGGSETERTVIATANVWVRGRGSVDPILPSSQLPATWQCDIEIMAPPGVSVTPRIVAGSGDWSNKSVQGTGVASSATDWTWQPITVQRREGTWAYRVELTANSNDTRAGFKGAQFEL